VRLVALLLVLFSAPSLSRGVLTDSEERAWNRAERQKQEQLAHELAVDSDVVFIGTVVSTAGDSETVTVRTRRVLKGAVAQTTTWKLSEQRIVVSSRPSDRFRSTALDAGASYILYVKDGSFLRAGPLKRYHGDLSLSREFRIVKATRSGT
jgi:hypothetical protein